MTMADIIRLPPASGGSGDEPPLSNTERNQRLFAWALGVLQQLGLVDAVMGAPTVELLQSIILDIEDARIILEIRDALHPANGKRAEHFIGLTETGLRLVLKNRLNEIKKDRHAFLSGHSRGSGWELDLKYTEKGKLLPNLHNVVLIMREAAPWKNVLGFDEFGLRVIIQTQPPWGREAPDTPWADQHETLTRMWFQRNWDINPPVADLGRGVEIVARDHSFHPVRKCLTSLQWDNVVRTDTWLIDYCGADDTDYVRAIGSRWLISAVARIFEPGAQVDHTLIFEGPQGWIKSTLLRTIAMRDEWFTDRLSHMGTKDAAIEMAGAWIIELAEMDALNKAASSTSKAFLTRRWDRFRPPYGRRTVNQPRQCAFAGTINPPANGRYLKDQTGARRYWPVRIGGRIDLAKLKAVVPQLWAEARMRYERGDKWWLETPELEALATIEQAARTISSDIWEPLIRAWLGKRTDVSIWEVLAGALGITKEKATQKDQNRVVAVLTTNLGFVQYRANRKGKRENRYRRD
jgi:predicted P-loop ATPase